MEKAGFGSEYHDALLKKCRIQKNIEAYIDALEQNLENGLGLVLIGPYGCGKTSIMAIIAKAVWHRHNVRYGQRHQDGSPIWTHWDCEKKVMYKTATDIYKTIFQKDFESLRSCYEADVLFIDDFGHEYFHDFPFAEFKNIIEHRHAQHRATIIATNLTAEKLRENQDYKYVVERWRQNYLTLQIEGPSMR